MTNADKIRQMTDEQLLDEIYRLQGTATACVACWEKKGRMMLEHYLKSEAVVYGSINVEMKPEDIDYLWNKAQEEKKC